MKKKKTLLFDRLKLVKKKMDFFFRKTVEGLVNTRLFFFINIIIYLNILWIIFLFFKFPTKQQKNKKKKKREKKLQKFFVANLYFCI